MLYYYYYYFFFFFYFFFFLKKKALINKVPAYQIHFVVPNFDKGIHHWFDNRSLEKRVYIYIYIFI